MTIFLAIFKVFGWILLFLLIFVLFCIVLVLFVPVRYRILGKKETNFSLDARFSWLFHLVRVFVFTEEDSFAAEFRILFFRKRIYPSQIEQAEDDISKPEESFEESLKEPAEEPAGEDCREEYHEAEGWEEDAGAYDKENRSLFGRVQSMFRGISGKLKDSKRFGKHWRKMLADKRNKQAVSHLKRELFFLLKALCPGRMRLTAAFSAGAPDITGQILGVIALFPAAYQNRWQITPDFMSDNAYLTFDADIKGHFFLICAALSGIRVLFDFNCRRLFALLSR